MLCEAEEPIAFIDASRAADVHGLIAAARRAAAFREGWHQSRVDPRAVLAGFAALRLNPGCTLR